MKTNGYKKAYGTWHVTTDGDCEGKSTREIGTYTGWLDEIALSLANQAMYDLKFERVEGRAPKRPTADSVHVVLDIDSGTWHLSSEARVEYFKEMLKGRPVEVVDSNYYAAVQICKPGKVPKIPRKPTLKESALSKLTDAEKIALGLA